MPHIRQIITDIEGTTTDIAFVHNVLFPYAAKHLTAFIQHQQHKPIVRQQLQQVAEIAGQPLSDTEATEQLQQWIQEDKKIGPLKTLQGLIWAQGYANGELKGHVYDDAAQHLKQWHQHGHSLYVYSSGSVKAQQLIYGHSNHGDLSPLFSGYFDTRIGHKRQPQSYEVIRDALGGNAASQIFLSDVVEELDAAQQAGMHTALLVREGNAPQPAHQHPRCTDFADVSKLLSH